MKDIERKIKERARFFFICKHNGREPLRKCLVDAIFDVTQLNQAQLGSVFDVLYKDVGFSNVDSWADRLYKEMENER